MLITRHDPWPKLKPKMAIALLQHIATIQDGTAHTENRTDTKAEKTRHACERMQGKKKERKKEKLTIRSKHQIKVLVY